MSTTQFYGNEPSALPPRLILEALGTGLLVLVGLAAVMFLDDSTLGFLGVVVVALAFGVILLPLVEALGPRTGAHLNPAVTIAAMASRAIGLLEGLAYMAAQLIGATSACLLLKAFMPDAIVASSRLGMTVLNSDYSLAALLFFEFAGTFILTYTVLYVAVSSRVDATSSGKAISSALVAGIILAGVPTGAGLNPARVLGPMFGMWEFDNWVPYLLAEFTAGISAAIVFKTLGHAKQKS